MTALSKVLPVISSVSRDWVMPAVSEDADQLAVAQHRHALARC